LLGEHSFSASEDKEVVALAPQFSWRYGYSLASRDQPDRRRYLASRTQSVYTLLSDAGSTERFFSSLEEEMHEGGLDFQWPFSFGDSLKVTPAVGGLVSVRTRELSARGFQFDVSSKGNLASPGYSGQRPD